MFKNKSKKMSSKTLRQLCSVGRVQWLTGWSLLTKTWVSIPAHQPTGSMIWANYLTFISFTFLSKRLIITVPTTQAEVHVTYGE